MTRSLPPPLMISDPRCFARSTIVERKPQNIQQVIEDNGYPPEIEEALYGFQVEIASGTVKPLAEGSPESSFWNREAEAFRGRGWLELPWYFAETFFYHRLLDDRHWPHTERLEEIANYFPSTFLAVRTLKGEIIVGLEKGQAERLTAADPDWLIDGRRGLIHLVQVPSTN